MKSAKKGEKGIDKGGEMGYNNGAVRESGGAEARQNALKEFRKKELDKRAAK